MVSTCGRGLLSFALCLSLAISVYWAFDPDRGLLDFGSFVMAGEAYERGLDPYTVHKDLATATGYHFGYTDGRGYSPNLNPPITVYPFRLLADVDPESARLALNLASAVIFALCSLTLLRADSQRRRPQAQLPPPNVFASYNGNEAKQSGSGNRSVAAGRPPSEPRSASIVDAGFVIIWLAALAGFWSAIWLGQIYLLLLALTVVAWFLLERQNLLLAGLLIGLIIVMKPNYALWPLLLLAGGNRRPACAAGVTFLALSAIPLLIEGPSIYRQWLQAAADYPRAGLATNASLIGEAHRLGLVPLGYLAVALLGLAAIVFVRRARPSVMETSALAIALALFAGPLSWIGYTLCALPMLLSRPWRGWEWAVALTFAAPAWLVLSLSDLRLLGYSPIAGLYFWGVVIILGLATNDAFIAYRRRAQVSPVYEALPAANSQFHPEHV